MCAFCHHANTLTPRTLINTVKSDLFMTRYKVADLNPRFLAVDLEKLLLPSTIADAVHHLLDYEFDISSFGTRYRNDDTGAPAYGMSG